MCFPVGSFGVKGHQEIIQVHTAIIESGRSVNGIEQLNTKHLTL